MAANGSPGDPPSRVGWPVVDTYTGTLAALAVLAALLQRERFGEGQFIDVAMLDASVVMMTSLATPYLITGKLLPRTGDTGYSGAPTAGMFCARDGSRLSLGAVQNNQFAGLCRVIGQPELIGDPRFATPETRVLPENASYLQTLLSAVFATRDAFEWETELTRAGVPCGRVRDVGEVCDQLAEDDRGLLLPTRIPGVEEPAGTPRYVNAGFKFAHDGPGAEGAVPVLGEHTSEVLKMLGYDEQQITQLVADNSVRLQGSRVDAAQVRK